MNVWRIIAWGVGLLYCLLGVGLGVLHAMATDTPQVSVMAAAVVVCGLAVLAGASRRVGNDPLRFGAMLFLGLLAPVFAAMAIMLFGGVAQLVLDDRNIAETIALVGGGGLAGLNVVCIIALVRIGKLERARRRAARRARFERQDRAEQSSRAAS